MGRNRAIDDGAEAAFRAALASADDNGPSGLMRERAGRLRATPSSADWNGVWRLATK